MWGFFGGQQKGAAAAAREDANVSQESPRREGLVDMTSLDITYITHRLVGEWSVLCPYLPCIFRLIVSYRKL